MRKFIYQLSFISFFSWLLIVIVSCKDAKETGQPGTLTISDTNNKKTVVAEAPAAALIGGTLDTLWISNTDFPANPEKIIFTFTIDASNELKLHGWKVKNGSNQFDPTPNYRLTNAGQHKSSTYGPDMYFGSIVLKSSDVQTIINKIRQGNYTKVLFVPKVTDGHIGYNIFVGKDDGQQISALAVDPTGTEANPSPPKNYN